MKISMVGFRGLDEGLGGVETVVGELAPRLVSLGAEVTCYCRRRYSREKEYRGVRLVNLPAPNVAGLETGVYAAEALRRTIADGSRIVHIHALGSATLSWMPKLAGKKIVCSVHGLDYQRKKWGPVARYFLRRGEAAAARADCTLCVSKNLAEHFRQCFPKATVRYLPNGVTPVSPSHERCGENYWLYMGRLTPEKGVHRLIEAFGAMDTDMNLVIAGPAVQSEDYERRLHELAAGDGRVRFVGSVVGKQKQSLLAGAAGFVLPSDMEGLPMALLEAGAAGVCPIVSDLLEIREVLGDAANGYLARAGDVEALRQAMDEALTHPNETRIKAERFREHVLANFNWDAIANELMDIYRELLGEKGD